MEKLIKYIFIFLSLAALVVIIGIFFGKDSQLSVHFLNIGQGDSILIRTSNSQDILIDGGPGNLAVDEIGHYLPFYDRDIELMILTHAHSDHVSGLVEVLKRYKVEQVLYSGRVDHQAPDYLAWLDIIEQKSIPLKAVHCCEEILLGKNLELDVLYPFENFSGKKLDNLNDSSVVTRLVYKDIEFLFTGDAPIEAEEKMIENNLNLNSDVLKVGHHGSKYSSSPEFLKLVDPDYAVIQSGEGNTFGHPHFKTLNNLEKQGIKILRNDQCGTISFKTDGMILDVESEKCD